MTIQHFIPGQLFSLKSLDTVINQDEVINYATELLNSLELPELPTDNFQLKVDSVIMMLHNIHWPNGTRLTMSQRRQLSKKSTKAKNFWFRAYRLCLQTCRPCHSILNGYHYSSVAMTIKKITRPIVRSLQNGIYVFCIWITVRKPPS